MFLVVGLLGVLGLARFDPEDALDSWALVTVLAVPAGIAAYALIEYLQTGHVASVTRQFDTRTLVLMPVAMAINIVLGTAVASALKIPVYLNSLGTILVAALAGPLAGALTGFLTCLVWTYLAAAVRQSLRRPVRRRGRRHRAPGRDLRALGMAATPTRPRVRPLVVGPVVAIGLVAHRDPGAGRLAAGHRRGGALAPESDDAAFLLLGWLAVALFVGAVVGLVWPAPWKRDLAAAYVVVAGVITGLVAAFIAAPIAANVFGGVTGSGGDFLVAAFRQAGADLQQAVLGQSLMSDPIDKVVTYLLAYLVLASLACARRHASRRVAVCSRRSHGHAGPTAWDRGRQPLRRHPGGPSRPAWGRPGRPPGTASIRSRS